MARAERLSRDVARERSQYTERERIPGESVSSNRAGDNEQSIKGERDMVARIKAIKPTRKFLEDINALEDELEKGLDELADETLELYKKTTKHWKTKVKFYSRKTQVGRSIGTYSRTYAYVDKGTKRHPITARRAPYLKFRSRGSGKPKTTVNEIGSSPGAPADGDWNAKKQVDHPGNEARNFTKNIEEKMRKRQYVVMRRRLKGLFSPRGSK
jgi:hypothetical protein